MANAYEDRDNIPRLRFIGNACRVCGATVEPVYCKKHSAADDFDPEVVRRDRERRTEAEHLRLVQELALDLGCYVIHRRDVGLERIAWYTADDDEITCISRHFLDDAKRSALIVLEEHLTKAGEWPPPKGE